MTRAPLSPALIRRLLRAAVPRNDRGDALLGDLEELYAAHRGHRGRLRTDLWYARQALGAAYRCRLDRGAGGQLLDAPAAAGRALMLGARRLVHASGFTAAATLSLAVGMTAVTLAFAAYHGVVLRSLPYPDPDRLVVIEHPLPGFTTEGDVPVLGGLLGQLLHYQERTRELTAIGGYWTFDAAVTGTETPEYLHLGGASAGFFRALGVQPEIGRPFDGTETDPAIGGLGRVILTHSLWTSRYGAAAGVIGSIVQTGGFDYEIVGVAPPSMPFPAEAVALWNAIAEQRMRETPDWSIARMIGRMAPGATPESVEAELDGLIGDLPRRFEEAAFRRAVQEGRMHARVTPLKTWLLGDAARTLAWLLLAACAVLVIAAANVTNLLAVRAEAARGEVAVRRALGANRGHVAGYFLAESIVVVATAGVVALGLAGATLGTVMGVAPADLPRADSVGLGPEVLAFLAAVMVAMTLLFALVPLAILRGIRPADLAAQARAVARTRARAVGRNALVGLQMAMAVVLLVGAGFVIRSAASLARMDPGFDHEQVLTFRIPFPFKEIQSAPGAVATPFYDRLAERLAALPGVESVGYGSCLPLSPSCGALGTTLRRGDLPRPDGELPVVGVSRISPGFLDALSVPLLAGRGLSAADHTEGTHAVLVSAGFAALLWPEGGAIGGTLVQDGRPEWGSLEVVGIVGDVRFDDLRQGPEPLVYVPVLGPSSPQDISTSSWVVRTSVPPVGLARAVRAEIASLRPDLPVASMAPFADVVAGNTASLRLAMWLLGVCSVAAIALSAIGVYGVVAYLASQRLGELGIRMALGARAADVRAMVLAQGGIAAGCGLALGLAGSLAIGRALGSVLYGVHSFDPFTYAAVALALGATALLAAFVPARRAARLDPALVLRMEV